MTDTIPTQEQVDQIVRELAPDVVRIRFRADSDWSGDPAFHFRIILSDDASRRDRLPEVSERVSAKLFSALGLSWSGRIPYMRFRSVSEQAKMRDASWE